MKRLGRLAGILCVCAIFLAGCGGAKVPETVDKPTVFVGKEGEITVWQVGQFDKAYYQLSELASMAEREAAAYNAEKGKEAAVTVEKTEALDGGKAMVVYRFDGWESCTDFGEDHLFFGTVKDAATNGFDMGTPMKSVKDDSMLDVGLLGQSYGEYLLVTDIKANIYCDRRVVYISASAAVNEDGSIKPSEEEDLVYILMK